MNLEMNFEVEKPVEILKKLSQPKAKILRRHICVKGVVQGVGFRPFVYSLAQHHGLK